MQLRHGRLLRLPVRCSSEADECLAADSTRLVLVGAVTDEKPEHQSMQPGALSIMSAAGTLLDSIEPLAHG